jgi:hypothetical protein
LRANGKEPYLPIHHQSGFGTPDGYGLGFTQDSILPGEIGRESRLLNQLGQPFDQINPDAFGLHPPGSVYFTSEDTLKDHPDLVRKFLRAVIL